MQALRYRRREAECREQVSAPSGNDDGCGAAQQRENQPFDGELTHDARAAGAERGANTDLALAIRCPREQQRRDVEARDEEDDPDDRQPDPRNLRYRPQLGRALRHRREAHRPRPCRLICLGDENIGDALQVRSCLRRSDARRQAPDDRQPVLVAVEESRWHLQDANRVEGYPEVRFE